MRRRIFFLLEKLQITPAERKTVTGLLILFVVLAALKLGLSQPLPFEEGNYLELERQFEKRTAMLRQKEQKIRSRYFPVERRPPAALVSDTLPDDSTGAAASEKEAEVWEKPLVNINKADIEVLKSLPGIGPTYARRIIAYRKEKGRFKTLDDLKKIKGIAQKRLEKLKPFIKLKGPQ